MERTEQAGLLDFVERFAQILADSGMQKMTARVFSYILIEDATTYTAAELSEGLGVSRAAISGAVRDLVNGGLIAKSRRADTRADVYAIDEDDVWGRIMFSRTPLIDRYREVALEGAANLPSGPGRERMLLTAEFMEFTIHEFEGMRERWNDFRRRRREQTVGEPGGEAEEEATAGNA
ncbi:GbsR/MarR family transcriptional regulator [Salininema proteolyticum]|uniref:GbsR/MarR family transcriptional regulator n=1 Tax=Salininema proteolyticum TaxID=1607685 RepID=A0ABV8TZF5_9ACTN